MSSMDCTKYKPRVPPLSKQLWTVSGAWLAMLAQGMAQGFMSVLLSALKKPDTPIIVDVHLASWLATGMAASVVIGAITSTFLMELLGRKLAFIVEVVPGFAAALLMYSADTFAAVLAARLLDGVTAGGIVTLGAVIIGEYVAPAYRGMFLNLKSGCICFGSTIVHALGHHFFWRNVALTSLIPYSIAMIIIFTWPESPYWLATKNRLDEAEKAFIWLRGDSDESRAELTELFRAQRERNAIKHKSNFRAKVKMFFITVKRKEFLQSVVVMVSCTTLLEMCGRHIVPAYVNDIVKSIVGDDSQSFHHTLALDLIVTISATCSCVLIKFTKTRTLLFSSGIISLVVLCTACLYLFLVSRDLVSKERPWIPLGLFIVYFVGVNFGCIPISLALVGEVVPLELKSYIIFTYSVICCIVIIATIKVFPYLMLYVDIYGTFLVLGSVSAIMLVILYLSLPETKNRTLQEIEDSMTRRETLDRDINNEEYDKMLRVRISQ